VRIRPESSFPTEGEIEIGDKSFDNAFVIEGPAPMAFALLDAKTRRLLLHLSTEIRLEIRLGELRVEDESDKYLLALLPRLLEIGRRLAQPPDVPRRLADNAIRDPEARVRFQNLLFLIREYPREPETHEVLRVSGAATAVAALAKVMEQEKGELAIAAAQALGETGSLDAEPPLILALQSGTAALRVAAVNALGRVGTALAVLPLQEAARRSLFDFDLRRAIHQAIAEIQSRLQGASPGQLSLTGAEAGQLSLAQADAGQLSLSADPAGQLSLGGDDEPGEA
jgi:HEAT repeat protein